MFDSHCHLDDAVFRADWPALRDRAAAAGVRGVLIAGIEPGAIPAQSAAARAWPGASVSWGVHPQWVAEVDDTRARAAVDALETALTAWRAGASPELGPVALGETGLDRSSRCGPETLPRQVEAFRRQLALARRFGLPVVLHVLRAHELALDVLAQEGLPEAGGVVHSYSGSAELVPRYVALGLYLSMAGTVSWEGARRPTLAARAIPEDHLLVETDAPDQTPAPHRPARNEPAWLGAVVEAVARARGEDPAHVAAVTARNARRLYRLEPL